MKLEMRDVMTPSPLTIGVDQMLDTAHALMRDRHVRHLPVLEEGRLVGILSDRDLAMVETLPDVDPKTTRVFEAMSRGPFVASPNTPLAAVVHEMAKHRLGSAVVVDNGAVVGVFTTTDALTAIERLLTDVRQ